MATYIALLRGVNVGANMLKMERLREICAGLGWKNARTYVQSGNVVFTATGTAAKLAAALEKALEGETRLPVPVIVRSSDELGRVIAANPFVGRPGVDPKKLHVTFLACPAPKGATETLDAVNTPPVEFEVAGAEIYLYCPENYGEIKLSNTVIEKKLGVKATTRNWNSVNKLYEMANEPSGN